MGTEKRQRQKEGHRLQQEELRRQAQRHRTRRRAIFLVVALVLFFGGVYVLSLLSDDGDDEAAPTTTAAATTECPEADGSSPATLQFDAAPPLCIDPAATYTAEIVTSEGTINVDLDTTNTPNTVNNFVVLSQYHYYDDTPVFRTDPSIGIIQAGGADNSASPGYTIQDEGSGYTYEPGQIVMARTGAPNSAGGQFFLVGTDAASNLDADGSYVVFGTTDQAGIDVVNAILALNDAGQSNGAPSRPVTIESITITES